jgi:hypothetical protein
LRGKRRQSRWLPKFEPRIARILTDFLNSNPGNPFLGDLCG